MSDIVAAPRAEPVGSMELQCRIEVVEHGAGFLWVSGWIASTGPTALRDPLFLELSDGGVYLLGRLLPRPDLAIQGTVTEAAGFCLDLPRPDLPLDEIVLTLRAGSKVLRAQPVSALEARTFRPRGNLDAVCSSRLAGWVLDPGLWYGPEEKRSLELLVDGTLRLPLRLNAARPDLPFSVVRGDRPLGFEFDRTGVRQLLADAGLPGDLLDGDRCFELLAGGQRVATRGRPRAPQAAPEALVQAAAPEGFIDYYGFAPGLGGWLFGGWLQGERLEGYEACRASATFEAGEVVAEAVTGSHARPDVVGLGKGYVCFLPAGAADMGLLHSLRLDIAGPCLLHLSDAAKRLGEIELLGQVKALLGTERRQASTPLLKVLAKPVFEGADTLPRLPVPVHLEVDTVVTAPGAGLVLQGWFVDPTCAVTAIRLRSRGRASASLHERWIRIERQDVREAFAGRYSLGSGSPGFLAYVDMPDLDPSDMHLELELAEGELAFKPLPAPFGGGVAAIRRILGGVQLPPDEVVERCDQVLGPPVVALNQQRLAAVGRPVVVEVGEPPARPRCSIIVPLYGRIDYLMYQCALFSEHGLPADELVYVLDDPPRKAALLDLAQSAWRRFGIPMRLVLLPENRGYAPANNAGLAASRGEYVCYLNSDVMPREPGWLDLLIGALENDATLGITGGFLTFEDGTVQHSGMTFKRLPQLGNFVYAMHPGKGRKRLPSRGLQRAEAVTGACMVLRRSFAEDLGGFDTNYVIGDFEDADLCMRIRAKGLHCAVHEDAVLWHLERQSQGAPGDFRHNLTLVNAWTFNRRWGHLFPDAHSDDGVLRLA